MAAGGCAHHQTVGHHHLRLTPPDGVACTACVRPCVRLYMCVRPRARVCMCARAHHQPVEWGARPAACCAADLLQPWHQKAPYVHVHERQPACQRLAARHNPLLAPRALPLFPSLRCRATPGHTMMMMMMTMAMFVQPPSLTRRLRTSWPPLSSCASSRTARQRSSSSASRCGRVLRVGAWVCLSGHVPTCGCLEAPRPPVPTHPPARRCLPLGCWQAARCAPMLLPCCPSDAHPPHAHARTTPPCPALCPPRSPPPSPCRCASTPRSLARHHPQPACAASQVRGRPLDGSGGGAVNEGGLDGRNGRGGQPVWRGPWGPGYSVHHRDARPVGSLRLQHLAPSSRWQAQAAQQASRGGRVVGEGGSCHALPPAAH